MFFSYKDANDTPQFCRLLIKSYGKNIIVDYYYGKINISNPKNIQN